MSDSDEKQIKAELNGIFGKIDKIIKRIDTEDPGMAEEPAADTEGDAAENPSGPDTPPAAST